MARTDTEQLPSSEITLPFNSRKHSCLGLYHSIWLEILPEGLVVDRIAITDSLACKYLGNSWSMLRCTIQFFIATI